MKDKNMTPLQAARQLRRRGLYLGTDDTGQPIYLHRKHLPHHLHVIGRTGRGKSRLLLWIFSILAQTGRPVILFDPKTDLFSGARDVAIRYGLAQRLELFDLSGRSGRLPGYNPLRPNGLSVGMQAKWVREGVKSAWGASSFTDTPQLARYLHIILFVTRALELPLSEGINILRPYSSLRDRAIREIDDPFMRAALIEFNEKTARRQEEVGASSLARLEPFCTDEIIRPVIEHESSIDIEDIILNNKILLINAGKNDPLMPEDMKLLMRMVSNDLLSHLYRLHAEGIIDENHPVYIVCDEFQNFATQQWAESINEMRGLGGCLIAAHQFINQLVLEDQSQLLLKSCMNDLCTKIVFGAIDYDEAELLAKNTLFLDRYDPRKEKLHLHAPVFAPKESRRTSYTRSTSHSNTDTVGANWSTSETEGTAIGEGESHTTTRGTNRSQSRVQTNGTNKSSTVGKSETAGFSDSTGGGVTASETESLSVAESEGNTHATAFNRSYARGIDQPGLTLTIARNRSDAHDASKSKSLTSSSGTAETQSYSATQSMSLTDSTSATQGESESLAIGESVGTSQSEAHGTMQRTTKSASVSKGTGGSKSHGITHGETVGATVSPYTEYVERQITSSVTYFTPEEQLIECIQELASLSKRHFLLKVQESEALFLKTPFVRDPFVTTRQRDEALQRITSAPYYFKLNENTSSDVIDVTARRLPDPPKAENDHIEEDDEDWSEPDINII